MSKKGGTWKKNKWMALKDIIERLIGENPMVAFILSFCILPNALPLFYAVMRNDLQEISIRIFTISAITVGAIIPLLLVKIHEINSTKQINEEIEINKRKFELQRDIELNKQKRYNHLLDAQINAIAQETKYLHDSMKEHETQMIIATARQLSNTLQGNKDAENSLLADHFRETLANIVEKLGSQSGKHNKLLSQIAELEADIQKADMTSMIEKKSSKNELNTDGNLRKCTQCNESNPPHTVRCKGCRKYL